MRPAHTCKHQRQGHLHHCFLQRDVITRAWVLSRVPYVGWRLYSLKVTASHRRSSLEQTLAVPGDLYALSRPCSPSTLTSVSFSLSLSLSLSLPFLALFHNLLQGRKNIEPKGKEREEDGREKGQFILLPSSLLSSSSALFLSSSDEKRHESNGE